VSFVSMIVVMSKLPNALYRAEQVRELDRLAIEEHGILGEQLMQRAGQAAFSLLQHHWPSARSIAVICGGGNNGGDGYVIAKLAKDAGLQVSIYAVIDPQRLKGDAASMHERCQLDNMAVHTAEQIQSLTGYDVIVDALLGTGLSGPVRDDFVCAIEHINQSRRPVLAVDIPSGLSADTGAVMGQAVKATATITFIGLKQGLFTAMGPSHCGQLHFDNLRVPPQAFLPVIPEAARLTMNSLSNRLGPRAPDAHKGHFGHVLIIGGNIGYQGAARLAAEAAARVGAGLVSVATRAMHANTLCSDRPEIMVHGVESVTDLNTLLQQASVIAIGPGLAQDDWAQHMLGAVLQSDKPVIVDADALNLLALEPARRDNWILTPHPGEAARMLQCQSVEIQQDRFAAVHKLQQQFGGVVVLKGAGTLIWAGDEPVGVCDYANPAMASGGMGDVLTGVIAGLRAQQLGEARHNLLAARLGVCVHAAAAAWCADEEGARGMLALDLMPYLRDAVNPD